MAETKKLQWYVVRVVSNAETQIAQEIEKQLVDWKLWDESFETLVLARKVEAIRRGVRQSVDEKLFPGYIFVRMKLTDSLASCIRNTPRVLGFLGGDAPQPVADSEVEALIQRASAPTETLEKKQSLEVGQMVRVASGLFSGMEGLVETVDELKQRAKLSISILGRPTLVELGFDQIEIVEE